MSSDYPLPPNPEEAISTRPLGPPPEDVPEVQPVRRRGQPLVAWAVILSIVTLIVGMGMVRDPGEKVGASRHGAQSRIADVEARYIVGANEFARRSGQDMYEQAKEMARGSAAKRLRFVVVAGEMRGPETALHLLNSEDWSELPTDLAPLPGLLRWLYESYAAGDYSGEVLDAKERATVERELGWLGQLALQPEDGPDEAARAAVMTSARRTFWGMIVLVVGMLGVGLAGLVGLFLFVVFIRAGQVRSGLGAPGMNGGLYAETFALWMTLFVLQSLFGLLLPVPAGLRYIVLASGSLATLIALTWPVLRGVPWRQMLQEVGLQRPERPWRELLLGPVCYASTIPLLGVGIALTLLLMQIQSYLSGGDAPAPVHPISEVLAKSRWWDLLQLLFLVSFVAPVVEETMFRGVLYRHLRDGTARLRPIASMLLSATVVSFIFAVIHPQGLAAVPALMSLAYGFNAAREWRGSLLPCMIAHGLNNGIVFTLSILMLSD